MEKAEKPHQREWVSLKWTSLASLPGTAWTGDSRPTELPSSPYPPHILPPLPAVRHPISATIPFPHSWNPVSPLGSHLLFEKVNNKWNLWKSIFAKEVADLREELGRKCVHSVLTDIPDNVNSPFPLQLAQELASLTQWEKLWFLIIKQLDTPLLSWLLVLSFPLLSRVLFSFFLFTSKLKSVWERAMV